MNEEKEFELIDQYIQDTLTPAERADVAERLQNDPQFAALYDDFRILVRGVRTTAAAGLVLELKELEQSLPPLEKQSPGARQISLGNRYAWLAVAASVAIFMTVAWWWRGERIHADPPLFASYYEVYPNVVMPSVRGETSTTSPLAEAYQRYDQGHYAEAIQAFQKSGDDTFATHFYTGSAYLATRDADSALLQFQKTHETINELNAQAEWYIALCYLYKKDKTHSEAALRQVIARESTYALRATALLDRLQKEPPE